MSIVMKMMAFMNFKRLRWPYQKKPPNVRMILALRQAEKRMDDIHTALDERIRINRFR